MKPAQGNYDLVEPVSANYSFCLAYQKMSHIVTGVSFLQLYLLHITSVNFKQG